MNKERAQEWIIALLSGRYQQGQSRLRSKDDEFCCLGVYCDTRVDRGIGYWKLDPSSKGSYYVDEQDFHSAGTLPATALDELDLPDGFEPALIHQNDTLQADFSEIAYTIAKVADLMEVYNEHKAQH